MDFATGTKGLTLPVQGILDYWKSMPVEKDLPLKSTLDPLSIATEILPHIFLVELNYEPFSAFIRLQGTYLNNSLGQHYTGKFIDETTFGGYATEILELYEQAAHRRMPYISHEEISSREDLSVIVEAIHLPLIDEHGTVKYILGAVSRLSEIPSPESEFVASRWEVNTIKQVALG
ncbi:PAS domain-containing protein [Kiloniella sp.]|uniref:PAS domain-containing protein n=1 Tax=Kiloniella sp. TaxID=1938587 RepID=UPI003B029A32